MKTRHLSKILDSHYFSFFALSNLLTQTVYIFAGQGSSLLLNMLNVHSLYCLLLHLFASLCHMLYFDAAKFSKKQFSFIYFNVSVVRQRNEYEKLLKRDPLRLHN